MIKTKIPKFYYFFLNFYSRREKSFTGKVWGSQNKNIALPTKPTLSTQATHLHEKQKL